MRINCPAHVNGPPRQVVQEYINHIDHNVKIIQTVLEVSRKVMQS